MANSEWRRLSPDRMSYQAGYRSYRLKADMSGWEFSRVDTEAMSYSANVTIRLYVGDQSFEVASFGNGVILLRDLVTLSPQEAKVVICVNGVFREIDIRITEGVLSDRTLGYEKTTTATAK